MWPEEDHREGTLPHRVKQAFQYWAASMEKQLVESA
jgi:hypothetical protein